jgi:hypothetical protein
MAGSGGSQTASDCLAFEVNVDDNSSGELNRTYNLKKKNAR